MTIPVDTARRIAYPRPGMGAFRASLRAVWAAAIVAALGPVALAQPPAEDRLRALEDQNRRLAADLEDLRRQIKPAPEPDAAGEHDREPGAGRADVDLREGVRITSPDGRFKVEFHDLTQVEGRFFSPSGDTLHNNFDIPRQRLYFTGTVDKSVEFYTVLNRGYGTFDVLDAYLNFKFDPAFAVRFGRTKTPFSYEYYKIAEGDLIAPERSVFVGNLSTNRQIGVMAYGKSPAERVEYAAGVFNGPRRSFQDFNNYKNPFLFVTTRPFLLGDSDLLRHLRVGAAGTYGRENDPLEPTALRTANDETTTVAVDNVSPAFLRFNPAARQLGGSGFWTGDVAWFYRSLTALAMVNGGYTTYALGDRAGLRVPFSGWSVAVTYFLTGEEITTRKEVEPRRPFRFADPLNHPGAIEPYFRAATLTAGAEVFDAGLADPARWSRDALVLDTGVNWYPNRYLRVFLDWQHSRFGSPVQIGPGRQTHSVDLFWVRTQLYY